jgi:anaerobic ribonucleoside-triphosphate reductase
VEKEYREKQFSCLGIQEERDEFVNEVFSKVISLLQNQSPVRERLLKEIQERLNYSYSNYKKLY